MPLLLGSLGHAYAQIDGTRPGGPVRLAGLPSHVEDRGPVSKRRLPPNKGGTEVPCPEGRAQGRRLSRNPLLTTEEEEEEEEKPPQSSHKIINGIT
jgi:hypothetical protein